MLLVYSGLAQARPELVHPPVGIGHFHGALLNTFLQSIDEVVC